MICSLCKGAQNLLCRTNWRGYLEWWSCPKCGGAGCSAQEGPAIIPIHKFTGKVNLPEGREPYELSDF